MSQESNCQLEGESGYAYLKMVTNKLRKRQQYMVSQVSFIYPLKIEAGPSQDQELESFPGSTRLGQFCNLSLKAYKKIDFDENETNSFTSFNACLLSFGNSVSY